MVEKIVKECISVWAVLIPECIQNHANLYEDFGIDDIDIGDIISDVESQLGISISDEEFKEIKTVQDLIDLASIKAA